MPFLGGGGGGGGGEGGQTKCITGNWKKRMQKKYKCTSSQSQIKYSLESSNMLFNFVFLRKYIIIHINVSVVL